MVVPTGFEPVTTQIFSLVLYQLSYGTKLNQYVKEHLCGIFGIRTHTSRRLAVAHPNVLLSLLWTTWESNPTILFAKETTCLRYRAHKQKNLGRLSRGFMYFVSSKTTYTIPRDTRISATSAHFEQVVNDIVIICVNRFIEFFSFFK